MKEPREQFSATLLRSGEILVVGGGKGRLRLDELPDEGRAELASAELYDPVAGEFRLLTSPLDAARRGHTATLLPNGKVLIAGGLQMTILGPKLFPGIAIYDPADSDGNPWSFADCDTDPQRCLRVPRAFHTATLLPNGKVLIAGGLGNLLARKGTREVELFDPITETFSSTASTEIEFFPHSATLLDNGRVLVVGGNGFSQENSTVQLYDPFSGTWTASQPAERISSLHQATLLPNGMVLFTGTAGATRLHQQDNPGDQHEDPNGVFIEGPDLGLGRSSTRPPCCHPATCFWRAACATTCPPRIPSFSSGCGPGPSAPGRPTHAGFIPRPCSGPAGCSSPAVSPRTTRIRAASTPASSTTRGYTNFRTPPVCRKSAAITRPRCFRTAGF